MAINVNNAEADSLTREFAKMEGIGLTDAIIVAMKEAIERRRKDETPLQTAARLRKKFGIELSEKAKRPLAKDVFDDMWEPN